jgi:two-component system, OmpR family, sensor histidine kinase KdpD
MSAEVSQILGWRALRLLASLTGVALLTLAGYRLVPVNATTQGFAYLLLVLAIASLWGFFEAAVASIAATLTFNYFFFPPVGTFTIYEPQNWVALFSFLATSLVAGRLSTEAKRRAFEAVARQKDLERLYTFSRAILLIDSAEPFPKQLVRKLAEVFELQTAVLYERRTDEFYRAGPSDFEGLDDQLRDAALQGTSFSDADRNRTITAVRLGAEPIAGLALQGRQMPDSVIQGIANLVAIGLERARAQDLAAQIEASRQSEKLRTTLIDAMAHELKTPLTSVIAATSAFLADPQQSPQSKAELIRIADEEAKRLRDLIDESLEMARLDAASIHPHLEQCDIGQLVREIIGALGRDLDSRQIEISCAQPGPRILVDPRLLKLAIKQLVDNAVKYSPPDTPLKIEVHSGIGTVTVAVTDHGKGIPLHEQRRIFERLYRSPSVQDQIPGSGLGLSIAQDIIRAHRGDLSLASRPGETTFRLTIPAQPERVET